jgi:hypothetical protein
VVFGENQQKRKTTMKRTLSTGVQRRTYQLSSSDDDDDDLFYQLQIN